MNHHGSTLAAGQTLPDKEVTRSTVSMLEAKKAMLRQRTLFEYGLPTEGPEPERGLPKERTEFANPIQQSLQGENEPGIAV
jgi:hypothetical protein